MARDISVCFNNDANERALSASPDALTRSQPAELPTTHTWESTMRQKEESSTVRQRSRVGKYDRAFSTNSGRVTSRTSRSLTRVGINCGLLWNVRWSLGPGLVRLTIGYMVSSQAYSARSKYLYQSSHWISPSGPRTVDSTNPGSVLS